MHEELGENPDLLNNEDFEDAYIAINSSKIKNRLDYEKLENIYKNAETDSKYLKKEEAGTDEIKYDSIIFRYNEIQLPRAYSSKGFKAVTAGIILATIGMLGYMYYKKRERML